MRVLICPIRWVCDSLYHSFAHSIGHPVNSLKFGIKTTAIVLLDLHVE